MEYSITENTSFLEAAFSAASINRSFSSYVHDRLSRARYNISYVTAEKETGYIIGQVSMFVHVDIKADSTVSVSLSQRHRRVDADVVR